MAKIIRHFTSGDDAPRLPTGSRSRGIQGGAAPKGDQRRIQECPAGSSRGPLEGVFPSKLTLKLTEIDLHDTRFMISEHFSPDRVVLSIKRIGLVQRPVVTKRGRKWVLVTGWKRVLACRELGLSFIPVAVLDEPDDRQAFLFVVHENLAVREFSYLEKAEILARLAAFGMKKAEMMGKILPLLKIPPTESHLECYLAVARFSPEIKRAIVEKNWPFSIAQLLTEFNKRDLRAISPILLPLGQNKQKEVLEGLEEISMKMGKSPRTILQRPEIRAILQSDRWPPVQKSERVRQALWKMRYPCLSSWKEEFDVSLKKIKWPKEITIEPAPFFEDEEMAASFRFRNAEEFRARAARLQELASREGLKGLWQHERKPKKSGA